jgi:hypothetical protein
VIGGLSHFLSVLVLVKLATHDIICSWSPWNFFILQNIPALSGSYFALPYPYENTFTVAVLVGTGILTTTLLAKLECSKIDLSLIWYSILLSSANSCITGVTLNGRLILLETLYVITSKRPSGGINVIERSLSNLPSLTH